MQVVSRTWRLAAVPAILAVPLGILSPLLAIGALVSAVVVIYLHRDPDRMSPSQGIVAPADGRITVVRDEPVGTDHERRVRVGVFMQVTDVHVNRAPLPGRVESVTHDPGGHWPAFSKASDRNERVTVDCGEFSVTLIAGALARRIHPYVSAGDVLDRGQRIGHISFGSRADVLMPADVSLADLRVEPGDRVRAGETVLADR